MTAHQGKSNDICVGVDIGNGSLKAVVATLDDNTPRVLSVNEIPFSDEVVASGLVRSEDALEKILSGAVKKDRLKGARAIFSIPSNLANLRLLALPKLESTELVAAATYRIQKILSIDPEDFYFGIEATTKDEDSNHYDAAVVAVPKEIIATRVAPLRKAGLDPAGAELEAQALLRVIASQENRRRSVLKDASVTIVDLGSSHSTLYVIQNRRLQFIRTVRFGMRKFEDRIMTDLEITREEACRHLKNPSTEVTTTGHLKMDIDGSITVLSVQEDLQILNREFTRLIRYFRSLHPERSYAGILDYMILCGGMGCLKGFPAYFRNVLNLRVETLSPFEGLHLDVESSSFSLISKSGSSFGIAVGLALKGLGHKNKEESNGNVGFEWTRTA